MAGPTEAEFAEVFASRARSLRRTAYLLCGDWNQAEDLVQTAFVKLYAAWPRVRDVGAVDAYLRQTLTRVYLDAARRHWNRETPTEQLPDGPADPVVGPEDRLVLLAALATIPPRQRACLVLRFFEDCTVEAAAEAMGSTTGTVKSNTARGLASLRARLADQPELMIRSVQP